MTTIKNFSPKSIIEKTIADLKEKEQKVISGRFGVGEDRKTLSAIGKELHLSRERIRQIERESLKKLAKKIVETNSEYISNIIEVFNKIGKITNNQDIASKFLEQRFHSKDELNSLILIFHLLPQIKKIEKTKELETGWILSSLSKDDVVSVVNDWVKHLEKHKKPATIDVLVKAHPNHTKYEVTFLSELPSISKKLVKTEAGYVGLSSWPEVNPRNVRDKIYYILKKENQPLHFDAIAKKINERKFNNKKIVRATVHNELIADNRFVLVGRGIYALKEWGYNEGTVKDVISEVIRENGKSMDADEIINAVLKKRFVKKNTILINLQTKKDFKKVGGNKYALV